MTRSEWFKIVSVMAARWAPKKIESDSAEVWFGDLEEFPADQVAAAAEALYRDGREWPPNGAQIRGKLIELRTDAPEFSEAYRLTLGAAGRGVESGLDWLRIQSPLAAEAAELYGWKNLCLTPIQGPGTREGIPEGVRRAHFREAFDAVINRTEREQLYVGIEAPGLAALPPGPKRIGTVARALVEGGQT